MPSSRRVLSLLALIAAITVARGDDPAPAPANGPAPAGQPAQPGQPAPPGKAGPPPDPAREQMFQDKSAEDALVLIKKPDIADVMEGLDRLAKLHSGKATSGTIDAVLVRT